MWRAFRTEVEWRPWPVAQLSAEISGFASVAGGYDGQPPCRPTRDRVGVGDPRNRRSDRAVFRGRRRRTRSGAAAVRGRLGQARPLPRQRGDRPSGPADNRVQLESLCGRTTDRAHQDHRRPPRLARGHAARPRSRFDHLRRLRGVGTSSRACPEAAADESQGAPARRRACSGGCAAQRLRRLREAPGQTHEHLSDRSGRKPPGPRGCRSARARRALPGAPIA